MISPRHGIDDQTMASDYNGHVVGLSVARGHSLMTMTLKGTDGHIQRVLT